MPSAAVPPGGSGPLGGGSRRRRRAALLIFLSSLLVLAAGLAGTVAVRHLARSAEERAAEARDREEAAREAIARDASAFCRHEILGKLGARAAARVEPMEERLGYEPVLGVASIVGEVVTREPDGRVTRREYVCRLKRTGQDWLALLAVIR